jgi:hypothetical protein
MTPWRIGSIQREVQATAEAVEATGQDDHGSMEGFLGEAAAATVAAEATASSAPTRLRIVKLCVPFFYYVPIIW